MILRAGIVAKPLFMLLLISVLSGCSSFHFAKSKNVSDQDDANSVLVFGYMDDTDAPFVAKWGYLKQVRPIIDEPLLEVRTNNKGMFYLENLPAVGSYTMESLGGPAKGFLADATWTWNFPDINKNPEFKRLQFKTTEPGLYYMGSYKIVLVKKGGIFGVNKYETVVSNTPSEKEALQKLLQHTKGTKWENIIAKRISSLK